VHRLPTALIRLVAIALLVWTATDLAYARCCLQGQTGDAQVAAGSGSSVAAVQTAHPDFDDCFCCARCVDTGIRAPRMTTVRGWIVFTDPVRSLAHRSAVLDHPPQNA
jgi:hypothetical protein